MEYDMEWLVTDYGKFLEKFGLDESSVRSHYREWQHKSGQQSVPDYLWYLFQVILGETVKQVSHPVDLQKNKLEIYSAMWFFRTHVEGQRSNGLQQLINDTKLALWQLQLPYSFQVKIAAKHCCAYCDQYDDQLFKPQELLEHMGFNSLHCTNKSGCHCILAPVAERNGEGGFELKKM